MPAAPHSEKAARAVRRTACLTIAAVRSATPCNSAKPEMVASERGNFLMAGDAIGIEGMATRQRRR